ncbi:MAG: cysteine desulfurase [Candidatus Poribacteria bacterium]|nr:cysteine desulfurase [Candidatus Poribacteria bacterium]
MTQKTKHTSDFRPLDVQAIRGDFPIFADTPPLAFLDSAASTQTPRPVVEAMDAYYDTYRSNIHRGVYRISEEATDQYEKARQKVAQLINAPRTSQVVFTRNTTESINLVAYSWGSLNIQQGDEIVLTDLEHHSNLVPWQLLAQRTGATLRFLEITDEGLLDFTQLRDVLSPKTKLVAITHVSNVLGTITPIQSIIDAAHTAGAKVIVDAAQSVPHFHVDVQQLDCDFLAFSGHKMCGPTGVGVLYGKSELLDDMPPFLGGGSMIRSVERDISTYADVPAKFEAGTPSIAEAIGLGAAVDYLTQAGLASIHVHEQELLKYAHERLQEIEGITIYGPAPHQKAGVISFDMEGIHPHDIAGILDTHNVAIRAGHHCAQPLMKKLDVIATARASFYLYNTLEDVDRLYEGLQKAQTLMTRRNK